MASEIGYAWLEGSQNEYKPYLFIGAMGEGFKDSMPIHLTEGRMPESNSEIILPKHVETNGGVKFKIGDILSLKSATGFPTALSLTRTIPICMRKTVVKQRNW